jgi:hypothetical protein
MTQRNFQTKNPPPPRSTYVQNNTRVVRDMPAESLPVRCKTIGWGCRTCACESSELREPKDGLATCLAHPARTSSHERTAAVGEAESPGPQSSCPVLIGFLTAIRGRRVCRGAAFQSRGEVSCVLYSEQSKRTHLELTTYSGSGGTHVVSSWKVCGPFSFRTCCNCD